MTRNSAGIGRVMGRMPTIAEANAILHKMQADVRRRARAEHEAYEAYFSARQPANRRIDRMTEPEYTIAEMLAKIEAKRAAMAPADRAALEAAERIAQRESFIRATGPCEHGDYDWETCPQCLQDYADRKQDYADRKAVSRAILRGSGEAG